MTDITHFLDAAGRLTQLPAKRRAKIHALAYLAEKIDPSRTYTEREVNEALCALHTFGDPATLRRELYDYGFFDRTPDGRAYTMASPQPTAEALEAKYCG